jgi:hypothetical protein
MDDSGAVSPPEDGEQAVLGIVLHADQPEGLAGKSFDLREAADFRPQGRRKKRKPLAWEPVMALATAESEA